MGHAFLVGIGGFFGAMVRHLVGTVFARVSLAHGFPYATLVVNILGCFFIGVLGGIFSLKAPGQGYEPMRLFVMVGVLGGFTTFSSFGYETFGLVRDVQFKLAFMNAFLQFSCGLGAVWLGCWVSSISK